MSVDFQSVMQEIAEANAAYGVDVRGGKKYLEVAKRVEVFRKHFGMSAGIITEILHLGIVQGEPVAVRAIINDSEGRTVACGTASEVIGQGNVNKASALENAETSAIGRALACLGLHGGEFASLNEMERIGVKPDNPPSPDVTNKPREAAPRDLWTYTIVSEMPEGATPREKAEAIADALCSQFGRIKGERQLVNEWDRRKHLIVGASGFEAKHPDLHERVIDAYEGRMMQITDNET